MSYLKAIAVLYPSGREKNFRVQSRMVFETDIIEGEGLDDMANYLDSKPEVNGLQVTPRLFDINQNLLNPNGRIRYLNISPEEEAAQAALLNYQQGQDYPKRWYVSTFIKVPFPQFMVTWQIYSTDINGDSKVPQIGVIQTGPDLLIGNVITGR